MTTKKATTKKASAAKAAPKPAKAAKKAANPVAKPVEAAPTKAVDQPTPPAAKKLSAIDAAAQVLAESSTPMNTKQMIEAMAAKNLWTSPGGKTPHATLYSAILREITTKGNDARFVKVDRGHFTAKK
jgi:hypothetical protein